MSQNTPVLPVTGVYSGLTAANTINAGFATLNTCWLGSSAPSDAPNGIPASGQYWIDTSAAGYQLVKRYDGSAWIIMAVIDTTNDILLNPIGGGAATIASAGTTNLGSKNESYLTISGTTGITAFGSSVSTGQIKVLTFSGVLTITHNGTSLILPGSANITTANGDVAIMQSLGSGNWKCLFYGRISGATLSMTGASATVASATTTDLASGGSNAITVSGTVTITSFGSNASLSNPYYFVRFSGALILTHNGTSLIIPGAQNVTTTAGDWAAVEYLGSGNWRVNNYYRSNGQTISHTGTDTAIASATTTTLTQASNLWNITGTTTITGLGSSASTANPVYFIRFTGALTFTHNGTSLILPGSANITTAAGDCATMLYLGSDNWRCMDYQRADGTAVAGTSTVDNSIQNFRLTLTTGVPVTTSDVTGATTIYCCPYKGNRIALYDGSSTWNIRTSAQFSLALGTIISGRPYDVFCYDNAGTPTLEFTAWTNDTTRATALTYQDGVLVKTGATTRRYLGTFYTTATTTTEDSVAKRFLWNAYNRVLRRMRAVDSANSWVYSTATFRQANANTANQVDFVRGLNEDAVTASLSGSLDSSGSSTNYIAFGLDSTTTRATDSTGPQLFGSSTGPFNARAVYSGTPAEGRHYLAWLEKGAGSGTQTWYGDSGGTNMQNGITGELFA